MAEMKYAVLGSGSSANSYIFENGAFSFLIDNGFTMKEVMKRADDFHFDMGKLKFIMLTHTHLDHCRGVGRLSRKLKIPVVMHHEISRSEADKISPYSRLDVVPGKEYSFDALTFVPFRTSHDAPHSIGFYFDIGGTRFTLLTDTGVIPEDADRFIIQSDVLFLETNYDEEMLADGPYPAYLKKRIASGKGHLSNKTAFEFLESLDKAQGPSTVYLCHLSDTNNSVPILEQMVKSSHAQETRKIIICHKGEALEGKNE